VTKRRPQADEPPTIVASVEALGRALREIRQTQRLTLREVGDRLGVSYQMVQKIEREDGNHTIATLLRYAEAVGYGVEIRFDPPRAK
jgi:transcriptional regulator with XRE-family HTH domain